MFIKFSVSDAVAVRRTVLLFRCDVPLPFIRSVARYRFRCARERNCWKRLTISVGSTLHRRVQTWRNVINREPGTENRPIQGPIVLLAGVKLPASLADRCCDPTSSIANKLRPATALRTNVPRISSDDEDSLPILYKVSALRGSCGIGLQSAGGLVCCSWTGPGQNFLFDRKTCKYM